jgi:hypothetical protein
MTPLDCTYAILDGAAALVLDLTEANGYIVQDAVEAPGRTWRTVDTRSPFIDGDHTVQAVVDSSSFILPVKVTGTTTAQMEARRGALEDAVASSLWFVRETVDGVVRTWRVKRPADTSWSLRTTDLMYHSRIGVVRATVQPVPTVSGV